MLKDEVLNAVKKDQFHVYAVSKVEEAIEILTGLRAGKKLKNGKYQSKTIFGEVEKELTAMRKILRPPSSKKNNSKPNGNHEEKSLKRKK